MHYDIRSHRQIPKMSGFVEILLLDHRTLLRDVLSDLISNSCTYFRVETSHPDEIGNRADEKRPDICILSISMGSSFAHVSNILNNIFINLPETPVFIFCEEEEWFLNILARLKNVRGHVDSNISTKKDLLWKIKSLLFN